MELLTLFIISIIIQIVLFIPAYLLQTDKLTDMAYSITFILLVWIATLSTTITIPKIILSILVTLWGLRLGTYLVARIWKTGLDNRFNDFRKNFFGFLGFWVIQGVTVFVVLLPAFFFINSTIQPNAWLLLAGGALFIKGLFWETIADLQMWQFKADKKNKGKFINVGVWKKSRHPNYFGEILVWLGAYVFAFSALNLTESIIGLVSPLFIFVLLRFFSGVPPLEKKNDKRWGDQKDYQKYKKNTPLLFPKVF